MNNCLWAYDEFNEIWKASCGYKLFIDFDTPTKNNILICPNCKKKIEECEWVLTQEEALKIAKMIDEDKGNNKGSYVDVQELVYLIYKHI